MIAYKIEKNTIYLSDPNYPDASEGRKLVLERKAGEKPSLTPIYASIHADEDALPYDRIGFFATFSLVDRNIVYRYWSQVKEGGPVAANLFPEDIQLEVSLGRNERGEIVGTLLSDEIVLTKEGTASIGSGSEGRLYWRFAKTDPSVHNGVNFYRNLAVIPQNQEGGWRYFDLEPGLNELGLMHMQQDSETKRWLYVNYHVFKIYYLDEPVETVRSEPTKTDEPDVPGSELIGIWVFEAETVAVSDPEIYELFYPDPVVYFEMEIRVGADGKLEADVYGNVTEVNLIGSNFTMFFDDGSQTDSLTGTITRDSRGLIIRGEGYTEGDSIMTGPYWSRTEFTARKDG